ncbi:hypothetical protein M9Y10_038250 [Tritrichomonas musculus]|uniref:Surface antigen BspA-like n=1 Tax=Tritrichomonas musculus TaxID=1915356 RepID=A0ABR2K7U5_9EUKA
MNISFTRLYGINLELGKANFTAKVVKSPTARGNVVIPRSICYGSNEYIITTIDSDSFSDNSRVLSIGFAEDSELTTICANAFSNSSIETLSFPPNLKELEEGWCSFSTKLKMITVSPNNPFYISLNSQIIVGKNDPNDEIYENLIFVSRNCREITIPSFIKRINPHSFQCCEKLVSISFEKNSELLSIGRYSFTASTSLKQIRIPSKVLEICDFSFFQCKLLEKVEFSEDSELQSIGKYSFSETSIRSFTIPPKLKVLDDFWSIRAMNLEEVKISPKNETFSYMKNSNEKVIICKLDQKSDILIYAHHLIEKVVIPSTIKRISPFAFFRCDHLQSVEIESDTNLHQISKYAFSNSSIRSLSIPSSIEDFEAGWCFDTPQLNNVLISPVNRHFSMIDKKIMVKNIDLKSDTYSILCFVCRNIEKVIVPSFITTVNPYAFADCKKLKTVVFTGDSKLVSIEMSAFSESGIESITIPKHVKKIGEFAFNGCSNLKTVNFSQNSELEIIEKESFSNSFIEYVSIPSSVKKINEGAFSLCTNLKEIEFEENSKIELIDKKTFFMVSINSIDIPSTVKEIDECAFFYCNLLNNVIFQGNSQLEIIGKSAFSHSALKTVFIPSHVKYIKEQAFFTCLQLETIEFEENSELISIDKEAFLKTSIHRILIPRNVKIIGESSFSESLLDTIEFEEDSELEVIGQDAFSTTGIDYIHIPNHVKQIEESSFHYCCKLHTIELDEENSELKAICGFAFSDSTLESITIPANCEELKDNWCCGTTELMDVIISPNNKFFTLMNENTIVGKSCLNNGFYDILYFAYRTIKEIVIPRSIRIISSFAFSGCQTLQKIEFEEGSELVLIDKYAFSDSAINEISLPLHIRQINESAFSDCNQLSTINILEDAELETIDKYAFSETSLNSLNFSSHLRELKDEWCGEVSGLNNINISPNNPYFSYLGGQNKIIVGKSDLNSEIYETIVFACRDITQAFIPYFVKCIGVSSFYRCKSIEKVEFSENSEINIIGKSSFSESSIKSILIPASVTRICERAFFDCPELKKIEFHDNSNLSIIEKDAFSHSPIERIIIPAQVNYIKEGTFLECSNLKTIEFLSDFVSIEAFTFLDDQSLFLISFPNALKLSIDIEQFNNLSIFIKPDAILI